MRKKLNLFVWCILFISYVQAQKIITGFASPESVLLNGNQMFVSNIGAKLDPFAKDGDGFLSMLTANGIFLKQKFQQGVLHAPKGLAVVGAVLYVADIDRIVGFDTTDGRQVFELPVKGALLLNDLCKINDSTIVVSDSFGDRVYLIDLTNKGYTVLGHVEGPNGITYDAATAKLFVCTLGKNMNMQGKLFQKPIADKDTVFAELLHSPTGFFDGIEMMDNDRLIISDWVAADAKQGKLWIYDLKKGTAKSQPFVQSPADIYFDKRSRKVYTPQLLLNRIYIATVKK